MVAAAGVVWLTLGMFLYVVYRHQHGLDLLNEAMPHGKPLVQIETPGRAFEETRA